MSKRSRTASAINVQLFPFLAVLLCAMGGLIVLLVIITGKNRAVGKLMGQVAVQEHVALAERRNELEWNLEFVAGARDKSAQQLAGHRAALAATEDRIRQLRDEIVELEAAGKQVQQEKRAESVGAIQIEQQIAKLEAESKEKENELKKLREMIKQYEESFAVVPYEGPNSTRRRPIYIECIAEAIMLQPEGIRLTEDDFVFSDGPNNPLAAALRAAREYLIKNRYVGGKDNGDPYPLLLVRPDGVGAYYGARHAMTSWGSEFGYELIDQDWKVAYRPVDPGLATAMNRAVEDARKRGVEVAKAAPGLLDPEQRKLYRSAFASGRTGAGGYGAGGNSGSGSGGGSGTGSGGRTRGKFASSVGNVGGDGGDGFSGMPGAGSARGNGRGYGGGGGGGDGRGYGPGGGGGGSGSFAGNGAASGDDPSTLPYGDIAVGGGDGGSANGGQPGSAARSGTGAGKPGSAQVASRGKGNSVGNGEGDGEADAADGGSDKASGGNSKSGGVAGGGKGSGSSGKGTGGSASGSSATGANKGSSQGSSGGSSSMFSSNSSSGGGSGTGAGMGDGGGQSASASVDQSTPSLAATVTPQSMAKKRGRNWSVPEKARNAIPLTRPVSIRVTAEEFTLLSETGNVMENKTVSIGPRTEDSVDDLVTKVWDHVGSWNLAGQGMTWHPVIVAHVTPDGEQRFKDLQALMADSGLEIKHTSETAKKPAIRRR